MTISIAHLGPAGTYTEMAAMAFGQLYGQSPGQTQNQPPGPAPLDFRPYPTIAQALEAVAQGQGSWAVVPVENSFEGSVPVTLDSLWKYPELQIHRALVLPIAHGFLSHASGLAAIEAVYSHPQALAQCQGWLDRHLPQAERLPLNSTAQAVQQLAVTPNAGAIASLRAASLYGVPVLDYPINDDGGNCTRFLAVSREPSPGGQVTSIGFSVYRNTPGALMQALEIFAKAGINMSRIESRPTKRSMGDYRFFVDLEGNGKSPELVQVLEALETNAETFQLLGSYDLVTLTTEQVSRLMAKATP